MSWELPLSAVSAVVDGSQRDGLYRESLPGVGRGENGLSCLTENDVSIGPGQGQLREDVTGNQLWSGGILHREWSWESEIRYIYINILIHEVG